MKTLKLAAFAGLAAAATLSFPAIAARDHTRTISIFNMHTKEALTVTYKENGRYVDEALARINHMLRDWRRNEATKMNPRVIDLAYEVHERLGSKAPIHVVSGYRSPVTNAALRRRSRGVAKQSQHMRGNAIDLYFPDVSVKDIREAALVLQRGGVGYYPTSGRPFVHLDVGSVRHWPRMTRQQLAHLFPDGNTRHIPSDGKPLARSVPTDTILVARNDASGEDEDDDNGGSETTASIGQVASVQAASTEPGRAEALVTSGGRQSGGGLFSGLFGDSSRTSRQSQPAPRAKAEPVAVASAAPPQPTPANLALLNPPVPALRPIYQIASADITPKADPAADAPVAAPRPFAVASAQAPASASASLAAKARREDNELFVTGSTVPSATPAGSGAASAGMGGPMVLASLGSSGLGQVVRPGAAGRSAVQPEARHAGAGSVGIWSTGMNYRPPAVRGLVSGQRVLGQAFATLSAPDQRNLGSLVHSPVQSLDIVFDPDKGPRLSPDRFSGAVIKPLQFAQVAAPFQTAFRR